MMSANAPLTDQQCNAVTGMRAMYKSILTSIPLGTAESIDQRARRPDPGSVPADVTVRVEIAPPSSQPPPLLDSRMLKTPERVPIYFYALHGDRTDPESDAEPANTRVIFFIHGGGNITGHPTQPPFIQFYTQLLRAVASHSGDATATPKCVLIAPSYRLATVPENAFPAALQDLVAAYDYVLEKGYDASNITMAGDSAGGNHAVVLTHLILQSGRPSPCGIVSIAPSAIQVHDNMSEHAKAHADKDILDVSLYEKMRNAYVGDSGVSPTDPLVSSAFIPFSASFQWPRTLIFIGTADQLIDGARELEKRLAALNFPVELVEYDERPHGWWVMPHIFPENIQDAAQRIARFVISFERVVQCSV